MALVLVYTSPARGHLYPIVPTLLELRARGHDVRVHTLASEVAALEAAGLDADPIDPRIEALPLEDWKHKTFEAAIDSILVTFGRRAAHEIPELQTAVATGGPDLLLVDVTTPGAAAVAEATGLPWARWMPYFQHATLDPDSTPEVTLPPYSMVPRGLDVVNEARVTVGLEPLGRDEELWRAPLNLYLTAPPMERSDLVFPSSFRFIGPGTWEPPSAVPAWLDEVLEPLILVAVSSEYQNDDALVSASLAGLANEGRTLVVSSAAHDPDQFRAHANVRLERFLSHGPVMSRAACVVCHGGMGVTQKALAAGVPVCVVPFGRDQFEVAGHVVAADAGIALMPDQLSPDALREAVQEAQLKRAGAARVAAGFQAAGGAAAAADALEQLLVSTHSAIST